MHISERSRNQVHGNKKLLKLNNYYLIMNG